MNLTPTGRRPLAFVAALAVALSVTLSAAAPAALAQSKGSKPAASAKKSAKPVKTRKARKSGSGSNWRRDAATRERALKRLKDYNYVKSMSPYAGSPNKWGSKW